MPSRRPLTVIGILFLLASIGIGSYFFGVEYPKQVALSGPGGRTATGVITGHGEETNGRLAQFYSDIEFADERGRLCHLRAYYAKNDWDHLAQGSTVTVKYLAKDPDTAMDPNSYLGKRDLRVVLALDGGLFLLGLILLFLARRL